MKKGDPDEDSGDEDSGDEDSGDENADEEELGEDDLGDDAWASAWTEEDTEEDDVIPVDESLFGADEEIWMIEDEGEDDPGDEAGDSVGGGLPTIRTTKRTPGGSTGTPPRRPRPTTSARPGSASITAAAH